MSSCFVLNSFVRYHSLAPMYYRGAQAAIVVYDITNTVRYYYCYCYIIVTKVELLVISPGQLCQF
jgi:GTPase SAR1 family protein